MCTAECDAFQIFSVRIHHVDVTFSVNGRAEGQVSAIGRPGRRVVDPRARRNLYPFLAVRRHDAELV